MNPDVAQTTQAITDLEAANVSPSAGIQPVAAGTPGSGMSEPGVSLEAPLGTERTAGPAMDAGRLPDQSDRGFIPLEPGTPLDAVDPRLIPLSQRQNALQNITEIIPATNVQDQTPAGPVAQGQAAPAQTPEARAAAGSPAAAAGTTAGDAQVQTAGVVARPTASWVLRDKATGEVVMETFDKKKVDALNTAKYEAVPIQQHLGELNDPDSLAGKWARRPQAQSLPAPEPSAPAPTARQVAIQAEKARIEAKRAERSAGPGAGR